MKLVELSGKTRQAMAQEVQYESNQQPSQTPTATSLPNTLDDYEDVIEEMVMSRMRQHHRIYEKIHNVMERFCSTRIGYFITGRVDRILKTLEDTAKWSLPRINDFEIERPLPWVPFLLLILALRLVRVWLSVLAIMIGNTPVTADELVYFIQTRRRKLRSVRMPGMKAMRKWEQEKNNEKSMSFPQKVLKLLSTAICRPGLFFKPSRHIFMNLDLNKDKSNQGQKRCQKRLRSKRPRDDDTEDSADHNLTCDQMLSKYANENSDDDSDFLLDVDINVEHNSSSSAVNTSTTSTDTQNERSVDPDQASTSKEQQNAAANAASRQELHDTSVSIENVERHPLAMPKPLPDIKKEPLSDCEQPKTPVASNGSSNRDEKCETADVARSSGILTQTREHIGTYLTELSNGLEKLHERATPTIESGAVRYPTLMSTLDAAATANKSTSSLADTLKDVSQTPTPLSSNASASSLGSLLTSDELINIIANDYANEYENSADEAKTPTPASSEWATLTSASSSEDVFYSPIGSPIETEAFRHPIVVAQHTLSKPTQDAQTHSTPKGMEQCTVIESPILPKQKSKRNRNRNRR